MDEREMTCGEWLCCLSHDEQRCLEMVYSQISRPILLARLEKLGELSAFLEAESGTKQ